LLLPLVSDRVPAHSLATTTHFFFTKICTPDSDSGNKGYISSSELSVVLSACCDATFTTAEIQDKMNNIGRNIDSREFMYIMTSKMKGTDMKQEFRDAFSALDVDRDGIINQTDLKSALSTLFVGEDLPVTEVDLKDILKELDHDGAGGIQLDALLNAMAM